MWFDRWYPMRPQQGSSKEATHSVISIATAKCFRLIDEVWEANKLWSRLWAARCVKHYGHRNATIYSQIGAVAFFQRPFGLVAWIWYLYGYRLLLVSILQRFWFLKACCSQYQRHLLLKPNAMWFIPRWMPQRLYSFSLVLLQLDWSGN